MPAPESPPEAAAKRHDTPRWENGYRFFGLTIVLLLVFAVLLFLAPVADIFLLGLLISFLMHGPCRLLARRTPLSAGAAVAVAYLALFAVMAWITWQGAGALQAGLQSMAAGLDQAAAETAQELPATQDGVLEPGELRSTLGQLGLTDVQGFADAVKQTTVQVSEHLTMGLKTVLGLVALLFTAAFFSFFLQLGLLAAGGQLRQSLPAAYYRETTQLLLNLDGVWVGYATAMLVYCGLLTVGSYIMFFLLGVPYALPMAIFNGLITLIPSVGGLIGTLVTMTVCLVFGSTRFTDMSNGTFAMLVAALHFVLVQVTYNFIALPVISRYVRLPVAAVLLAVLAALATGNVLVAFLVPPLLSTLRLLSAYVLAKVRLSEPFPGEDLPTPKVPGFFSQLILELK